MSLENKTPLELMSIIKDRSDLIAELRQEIATMRQQHEAEIAAVRMSKRNRIRLQASLAWIGGCLANPTFDEDGSADRNGFIDHAIKAASEFADRFSGEED